MGFKNLYPILLVAGIGSGSCAATSAFGQHSFDREGACRRGFLAVLKRSDGTKADQGRFDRSYKAEQADLLQVCDPIWCIAATTDFQDERWLHACEEQPPVSGVGCGRLLKELRLYR